MPRANGPPLCSQGFRTCLPPRHQFQSLVQETLTPLSVVSERAGNTGAKVVVSACLVRYTAIHPGYIDLFSARYLLPGLNHRFIHASPSSHRHLPAYSNSPPTWRMKCLYPTLLKNQAVFDVINNITLHEGEGFAEIKPHVLPESACALSLTPLAQGRGVGPEAEMRRVPEVALTSTPTLHVHRGT